ncbi:MAG: hypothetical protein KJ737_16800 [Proteobacteria bacterium]|nr:hypothetical protein [Pseudomonadota bacterium]
MNRILKWVVGITILALVGGLCFFVISLNSEKKDLQVRYDTLTQKNELLLQKVREEKSKAGALMHKNNTIESQQAGLRGEIAAWEKKYNLSLAENHRLQDHMADQEKIHADKLNEFAGRYRALEQKKDEVEGKYKDALQVIAKKEQEIKTGLKTMDSFEAKLKRTDIRLNKCQEKNAELCNISTGLLDKIENQSVLGSILKNENFVQLKRVEVEKIAQEYQDKIDKLKIDDSLN